MSFFGGMPFPVQFFLAFVIVLALIGATAWAVRRFGSGRLGGVGMRGRQPRLAVIDYASVDGRRRLILIRRDNVEHLVMIGGPTDVVVESNIVRAAPASRDAAMPRGPAMETPPPRPIPLPDNTNGAWPLQPEPATASAPARPPRNEQATTDEPASWPLQPHAEAPARPPRESLAALADELSPRSPAPPRSRPQPAARPAPIEPPRPEPRQPIKAEPRMPAAQPVPAPAAAEPGPSIDQSLAEMAHKLEAALRKPKAERGAAPSAAAPGETGVSAEATADTPAPTPATPPAARINRIADAKPTRNETKPPPSGKALYDSLEQEMASLLGRPTAKN